jgi:hypothetical protein
MSSLLTSGLKSPNKFSYAALNCANFVNIAIMLVLLITEKKIVASGYDAYVYIEFRQTQ